MARHAALIVLQASSRLVRGLGALLLAGVLIHGVVMSVEAVMGVALRLSWNSGWSGLIGWAIFCVALGGLLSFLGPFIADQARLNEEFPSVGRLEARLNNWIRRRGRVRRSEGWWEYHPEEFP